VTAPEPWRTPQVQEALARLEEAEVGLDRAIVHAKQVEQQIQKTKLSEEDIRLVEEHARGADAPRQLRQLQERVDNGELSWQDIAAGRHLDDPRVRAALDPGVTGMRQAYAAIQEGQDLDEIIETGPPTPPPPRDDAGDEYDVTEGYEFNRFDPDHE
jgi:hypothetical protein